MMQDPHDRFSIDSDAKVVNNQQSLNDDLEPQNHTLVSQRVKYSIMGLSIIILIGLLIYFGLKKQTPDTTDNATAKIFVVSDLHLDIQMESSLGPSFKCPNSTNLLYPYAPRYGCDSPLSLIESALMSMQKTNSNPDAIIIVGDLVVHKVVSFEVVNKTWDVMLPLFRKYFPSPINIFITLGNNDAYQDYDINPNITASNWLKLLSAKFELNKINYNPSTWNQAGYSSSDINVGQHVVKFINLNTVFYSRKNPFIVPPYNLNSLNIDHVLNRNTFNKFKKANFQFSATPIPDDYLPKGGLIDPAGQFELLIADLKDCSDNNKRPYIFGHIPPMVDYYWQKSGWFHNFTVHLGNIMQQFSNNADPSNVPTFLFAHQHEIDYRFLPFDVNSKVTTTSSVSSSTHTLSLLNAAVSPIYLNNPAYRMMTLNSMGSVVNFDDYWLDLSSFTSNWTKLYSSSDAYDYLGEWTATSAINIFSNALLNKEDPGLNSFCVYRLVNTSDSSSDVSKCKSNPKAYYCMMVSTENEDYFNCMN